MGGAPREIFALLVERVRDGKPSSARPEEAGVGVEGAEPSWEAKSSSSEADVVSICSVRNAAEGCRAEAASGEAWASCVSGNG